LTLVGSARCQPQDGGETLAISPDLTKDLAGDFDQFAIADERQTELATEVNGVIRVDAKQEFDRFRIPLFA
jgi:hypothetical protein